MVLMQVINTVPVGGGICFTSSSDTNRYSISTLCWSYVCDHLDFHGIVSNHEDNTYFLFILVYASGWCLAYIFHVNLLLNVLQPLPEFIHTTVILSCACSFQFYILDVISRMHLFHQLDIPCVSHISQHAQGPYLSW